MSNTAFVIERRFNAPHALVWRTFTEKDLLARLVDRLGTAVARALLELSGSGYPMLR